MEHFCCLVPGVKSELAHCWVLRRHLCGVFSGLLLVRLSNGSFFGLVATVRCWGVVVC